QGLGENRKKLGGMGQGLGGAVRPPADRLGPRRPRGPVRDPASGELPPILPPVRAGSGTGTPSARCTRGRGSRSTWTPRTAGSTSGGHGCPRRRDGGSGPHEILKE